MQISLRLPGSNPCSYRGVFDRLRSTIGQRAVASIDRCPHSGNRSKTVLYCVAVLGGIAVASATAAQTYPSKPVRVIVSTAPGGASDFILRPVIQKVSESLKQPFVVDNRAGANGIIAMELTAKAAADGYTLLFGAAGSLAAGYLFAHG